MPWRVRGPTGQSMGKRQELRQGARWLRTLLRAWPLKEADRDSVRTRSHPTGWAALRGWRAWANPRTEDQHQTLRRSGGVFWDGTTTVGGGQGDTALK